MENNDSRIIKFPSNYKPQQINYIPGYIQNYDIVFFTDTGIKLANTIYLRDICSSIKIANEMTNFLNKEDLGRSIGYLVDSYIKLYNLFGINIVEYKLEVHHDTSK